MGSCGQSQSLSMVPRDRCEADVGNFFDMGICRAIARSMNAPLPLGPLSTLLWEGARYLSSPLSLRPALHGNAYRTTATGRGAGVTRCPRALLLAQPKLHITPSGPTPTKRNGRGQILQLQARRLVPSLLRSLGFCVRVKADLTPTDLVGTSLLLSRELPAGVPMPRQRLQLPRTALWVRIFSSKANATQVEDRARIEHNGPQVHGFCEPADASGSRCVVDERLLLTLLRVARAGLLPDRTGARSFLGSFRELGDECTCAGRRTRRLLDST